MRPIRRDGSLLFGKYNMEGSEKMKTRRLVVTAMMIAIAAVLSVITPMRLPFGGGITLASMMPIVIIAYIYGTKWGLLTGLVYSILQVALGAGTISAFFLPGDSQMTIPAALCVCLIDYILAYTVLGFGGCLKGKMKNPTAEITVGAVIALLLRYFMHIASGAIFFGTWAEWFFSQEGFYRIGEYILGNFSGAELSLVYSVFYNGLYMIPEIIITAVVTPIVFKILSKTDYINP